MPETTPDAVARVERRPIAALLTPQGGMAILTVVCDDGAVFGLLPRGAGYTNPVTGEERTLTTPEWRPLPPLPGTPAAYIYHEGSEAP